MSPVLASTTGTDVVLALCGLLLVGCFAWGYNRWTNGRRFYAEEAKRPAPAGPNGFSQAILDDFLLKDRRRRERLVLQADLARVDLEVAEAQQMGQAA